MHAEDQKRRLSINPWNLGPRFVRCLHYLHCLLPAPQRFAHIQNQTEALSVHRHRLKRNDGLPLGWSGTTSHEHLWWDKWVRWQKFKDDQMILLWKKKFPKISKQKVWTPSKKHYSRMYPSPLPSAAISLIEVPMARLLPTYIDYWWHWSTSIGSYPW